MARDFAGVFKVAGGVGNIYCESSLMAEEEAVRAALMACVERGFGCVQIETNSKVLVDMLIGGIQLEANVEGILWDIHYLKQQLSQVEFLYHACLQWGCTFGGGSCYVCGRMLFVGLFGTGVVI